MATPTVTVTHTPHETQSSALDPSTRSPTEPIDDTGLQWDSAHMAAHVSSDVLFDTGGAQVRPGALPLLAMLVKDAGTRGWHGPVIVSGYTDDVGTSAYNLALSRRRATAVVAVLRGAFAGGIAMPVKPRGFGESHQFAPNITAENRRLNRRVVISEV